jgi:hypothetical protein
VGEEFDLKKLLIFIFVIICITGMTFAQQSKLEEEPEQNPFTGRWIFKSYKITMDVEFREDKTMIIHNLDVKGEETDEKLPIVGIYGFDTKHLMMINPGNETVMIYVYKFMNEDNFYAVSAHLVDSDMAEEFSEEQLKYGAMAYNFDVKRKQ